MQKKIQKITNPDYKNVILSHYYIEIVCLCFFGMPFILLFPYAFILHVYLRLLYLQLCLFCYIVGTSFLFTIYKPIYQNESFVFKSLFIIKTFTHLVHFFSFNYFFFFSVKCHFLDNHLFLIS